MRVCLRGLVESHPSTAAGTTTIHIMPAPLPLRAKGNRSLADYPGRGGWVRCVVLGVLPSRGSSLLAVLCPMRGAPVDCSPELPWEKEESYQRCLCRLKESAVDDCHRGSPLRGARSVHPDAVNAAQGSQSRVSVHRPLTHPLGTRGDSRQSHPGVRGLSSQTPSVHL